MRDDGHDRPTSVDPPGAGQDAPWLHGTWRVVRCDGAPLADGMQGPPWLTFDGDGMVFGHAGVNRVRGTWRLDGTALTFGPVVATLMAGPPGATATERTVLGVLQDGGQVTSEPDTFTLRTPGGRVLELVRAPDVPAQE
ncbi:META domain-containing protein [Cellulomonas dongxiuzhuiae]|uniref:META domain-containing protein n=1 Tax=Cellulomonas dongxiuzhuiae TaxID=2819979 RepID=A0ABX8GHE3_9CELL|nr:META domain-containing protein [Cellulomonas dongxiuzhuiae]MBO3088686.1 META domain-containing protein [Cellulomonas dongxiuzhuiae]MBO3093979.1 META domain-containing protein [Cellulomonas dongxiuzhuiae]QWC15056.1 META domain-containing protein [Cellulomonas dongxiuzhuiae]